MVDKKLDKITKDKMAENGILYKKYYGELQKYLRFNNIDYQDIKISFSNAIKIYHRKLAQLNAIVFTLNMLYSSNPYYDMKARELFGWSIDLIQTRLTYSLENQLKEISNDLEKKEVDSN